MNPDRLAELEEERTFLLRSLSDLEREHDAGDVDDVDYRELKDGYTVRAAATMRAIDEGLAALPTRVEANWTRRLVGLVVVVALIGVVWWVLAASSAERTAGQQITGLDPRDRQQTLLAEARVVQSSDPAAAADIYALVLVDDPDNVEALTYRGWTLALATGAQADPTVVTQQLSEAVESLLTASEADPTYADAHCFLGIIYFSRLRLAEEASDRIDACLAANPPADVRGLVESLKADIDAALDQP